MATELAEPVRAVVVSGPSEGKVVLLDPEWVAHAPEASDDEFAALNEALRQLDSALDRFIGAVRASADDYAAAARRMEAGHERS